MGNRCLYDSDLDSFLNKEKDSIFGILCEGYHGDALTTTREAWIKEIEILQRSLTQWANLDARIIFEYDIPRLGKRIDAVLLLKGIIFCLEFKVGETHIIESDVDQVLDYALDLSHGSMWLMTSFGTFIRQQGQLIVARVICCHLGHYILMDWVK